jgi:hypothetical protein
MECIWLGFIVGSLVAFIAFCIQTKFSDSFRSPSGDYLDAYVETKQIGSFRSRFIFNAEMWKCLGPSAVFEEVLQCGAVFD